MCSDSSPPRVVCVFDKMRRTYSMDSWSMLDLLIPFSCGSIVVIQKIQDPAFCRKRHFRRRPEAHSSEPITWILGPCDGIFSRKLGLQLQSPRFLVTPSCLRKAWTHAIVPTSSPPPPPYSPPYMVYIKWFFISLAAEKICWYRQTLITVSWNRFVADQTYALPSRTSELFPIFWGRLT